MSNVRKRLVSRKAIMWPAADEIWVNSPTQEWAVGGKTGSWSIDAKILSVWHDGEWWKYKLSGTHCGASTTRKTSYTYIFGSNFYLKSSFVDSDSILVVLNANIALMTETTNASYFDTYKTLYVLDTLVAQYKTESPDTFDIRPISQYPY